MDTCALNALAEIVSDNQWIEIPSLSNCLGTFEFVNCLDEIRKNQGIKIPGLHSYNLNDIGLLAVSNFVKDNQDEAPTSLTNRSFVDVENGRTDHRPTRNFQTQ